MIAVTALCCAAVVACVAIVCGTVLLWNKNWPR